MDYDYNPFGKTFDSLVTDDLAALRSVAEGWYIEYKREMPNAGAVAKSITAFANTYGGWIFYGIAEKAKDDPVAGSFPGILREEADACLQRLRQAVANHSQPAPYFRVKALFGPVEALSLPDDRCVIVAHVPWGPQAPHIHKDARIYRRVGDGSEPRPENDRYILDQLWSRSSKITQDYANWTGRELEISEAEKNGAYVRLFLIADFWRDQPIKESVPLRRVREIMSDVNGTYALPFDNVYRTAGGFTCRQTLNNDPEMLGLTWRLFGGLQSEVVIPLSKFRRDSLADLAPWLDGYEHSDRFLELCHRQRYHRPTIIDLNILLQVLMGITRIQTNLAREFGWDGPVYAKMEISGVWRTIPFFDTPHVLDEYEKHGMALSLHDKVIVHRGEDRWSFIELAGQRTDQEDESHRIMMAVWLFIAIATALGVSVGIDPEGDGSDAGDSIMNFLNAGQRALEVQKHRSLLK